LDTGLLRDRVFYVIPIALPARVMNRLAADVDTALVDILVSVQWTEKLTIIPKPLGVGLLSKVKVREALFQLLR
jgi:hypothetical protein